MRPDGIGVPMTDIDLENYASFARELAAVARAETLHWLAQGSVPDDKNAGGAFDPVTEGDRAAERAIRAAIEARYPEHGISGEEYGEKSGTGPWSWSLDPIDGTRAFICGLPSWTILIALLHEGRPVVGLIDAPRLDELFVGFGGNGTVDSAAGEAALRVSSCARLAEARLATTDPYLFAGEELAAFTRVREQARVTRYGLDAYAYARLAAGSIDLVIENGLKPHDYNALIPVVRAAGGAIGNWRGEDEFGEGKVVAAASQALFEEAVRLLDT
jgi:myo-inositol-1(or 4)-monophosphatase